MNKYFTEDKLIYYLCRVRAKYAKQRSKKHLIHLLSDDPKYNHHEERSDEEILLNKILPSRRKWKKLKKENRYRNKFQKINSIEYNSKSIYETVKYYKKKYPNEPFLLELSAFIKDIISSVNDPDYKMRKPEIYPKPKGKIDQSGKTKNVCRPISLFSLKDKIIVSQTNKYLTELFDDEFYTMSHAFRAPKKGFSLITHHNSVNEILSFKAACSNKELWVAECDMSKFYDSVGHNVIIQRFRTLSKQVEKRGNKVDEHAARIFYEFLNSYNFVRDVLPFNSESKYWEEFKIRNGEFAWVKKELLLHEHYDNIQDQRIGIPQGGALSGLIANIVLDYADSKILELKNNKLLYIRFCDDMIVIHPEKEACSKAAKCYEKALLDLKLVPHEFKAGLKNESDSFWKEKSKSPYKWSSNHKKESTFPWIGFVGYEVHFDGDIRVRKSSLKKEKEKQKNVVETIIKAIKNDNRRARKGSIIESAINRLTGMSIGRIHMWNHNDADADMCWVNGFKSLNDNPRLRRQLKELDKNRNHQIALLKNEVRKYTDPPLEEKEPDKKKSYYGKPFSYYHQTLKEIK